MEQKIKNDSLGTLGKKTSSALDSEYTIKLKPRMLIKTFVLVAIFASVFYLGRFSTASASCGLSDVSDFFSGMFSASEKISPSGTAVLDNPPVAKAAEPAAPVASSAPEVAAPAEPAATEPAADSTTAAAVAEPEEAFVTDYKKVALAIDNVIKIWKEPGVWGKITGIEYSIKNGESGSIKPAYFVLTIKGRDDEEKRFEVPYTSQTVKAGQTLRDSAAVGGSPSGFSFSKAQLNLQRVELKLMLYDAADKIMALSVREVDISGE